VAARFLPTAPPASIAAPRHDFRAVLPPGMAGDHRGDVP